MAVKNITATEKPRIAFSWFDAIILLLCLAGIGISGYLSYTRIFDQPIACTTGSGCETVNNSQYAYFLKIPVSFLGFGMYIFLAGLVVSRWITSRRNTEASLEWRSRLDWIFFIVGVLGVVFFGYLVGMSLLVIQATCIWCMSSAVTITLLFVCFAIRLWRSVEY